MVSLESHCDWAGSARGAWHEGRYAEMIRQYLLIMRQYPQYVWQLETVNEQLLPFLAKAEKDWPELVDEFWRRVKEGRIEPILGYSNPRPSEVYPELWVRKLVLGKEYFRRHVPGLPQKVYNGMDVMCGSSQMPQMLALADYRYFMFARPCRPAGDVLAERARRHAYAHRAELLRRQRSRRVWNGAPRASSRFPFGV